MIMKKPEHFYQSLERVILGNCMSVENGFNRFLHLSSGEPLNVIVRGTDDLIHPKTKQSTYAAHSRYLVGTAFVQLVGYQQPGQTEVHIAITSNFNEDDLVKKINDYLSNPQI